MLVMSANGRCTNRCHSVTSHLRAVQCLVDSKCVEYLFYTALSVAWNHSP